MEPFFMQELEGLEKVAQQGAGLFQRYSIWSRSVLNSMAEMKIKARQ